MFHTAIGCKEDVDAGNYTITAAAIHQQCQTIPHHQAIASTSILAEIARELAKTHPIKHKPSLTPPKLHTDQTSPLCKELRHHCHPPTTPSDPSPSGYCLHFNSHRIAQELAKTHPIKHKPSLIPPKIHIDQTLPFQKQLWHHCHPPPTLNNFSWSGYCLHLNSHGNHSRTRKDTSNQAQAFSHTSQNTHRSNIIILDMIEALLPSTDNAKQFLTIRLFPPPQLSWKNCSRTCGDTSNQERAFPHTLA